MMNSLLRISSLENRINQGPFICIKKKKKKKKQSTVLGAAILSSCQYLKKENSYLDKSGEQREP